MTDLAQISERMLALEVAVAEDPRPEVPIIDVISSLLGIELTPELGGAVLREVRRARELSNNHYARFLGKAPDDPALIGGIAFMQGITFARAVADIEATTPLLRRLECWANEHDADVSLGRVVHGESDHEWTVMMNFGKEAPDSPMYAGSALGADVSLEAAIKQALDEVKA